MRLFFAAIALLSFSLGAVPARADDASEARLQYELGSELYKQKRFTEALDRFIASNRLVPNPNVVFNIANIYVLLGKREVRDRARASEWYVEAFNWAETLTRMATVETDKKDAAALRSSILLKVAVVTVRSEPDGAEIYVDRESLGSVGRTPRDIATTPGDHTIILKAPAHRPGQVSVVARLGQAVPARVLLEKIVGVVQVTVRPEGAKLQYFPGSIELGKAPAVARLPVGEGRITATMPGFLTQTREIVVREAATTTVEMDLQRVGEGAARLTVVGQPDGASVRLAGREVGKVPLTLSGLDPGRHSVELIATAHEPWKGDLLLEAGAATRVEATLRRPEDQAWGGWKWLGYGAGAALLGGGTVFAFQARGAHQDFDAHPSSSGKARVDRLNVTADVLLGTALVTLATTAVLHAILGPRSGSHASVTTER
jgi:outer membrane receptor for ferrienterochelin and colicins